MSEQSSEGVQDTGLPADPQAEPKPEQLDAQTAELLYRQIRKRLGLEAEARDSVEKLCQRVFYHYNKAFKEEVSSSAPAAGNTPVLDQSIFRHDMLERIFSAAEVPKHHGVIEKKVEFVEREFRRLRQKEDFLQAIFEASRSKTPPETDEAVGIAGKRANRVVAMLRAHVEAMDIMLARDSAHFLADFKTIYEAVRELMPVVNPEKPTMEGFVEKVKARFDKTVYNLPNGTGPVAIPPPSPRFDNRVAEPTKLQAFLVEHIDRSDLDAPAAFDILRVCLSLFARLAKKNKAYGNSALKPRRILAKSDAVEQIYVRMDDKLNRLLEGEAAGEDVLFDLVGYWVILQIALDYQKE